MRHLLTWLSPAFPVGGFAYSHGLEWAVEQGDITDETSLASWLADLLMHGSGRNDAILLRHAYECCNDNAGLLRVAEVGHAVAAGAERLAETSNQGTAFALACLPWGDIPTALPYPVAVGALAGRHRIDVDITTEAYVQAFASNLISAAVRLVPLGQNAGLRALACLEPSITAIAMATRGQSLDELGGFALRSDLAAMHHETQYTRLFRS